METKPKTKKLLYVTNTDSNDISVVDVNSKKELKRIPIGGSPRGAVKFDKENKFGYVSNCVGDTISKIELNDNIEVARIKVGLAPRGLALTNNGSVAFVSNSGSNTLSLVGLQDCSSRRDICISANPRHMALLKSETKLFVCEWGSDSIAVFDINKEVQNIKLATRIDVGYEARPYSITEDSKEKFAYVANTQADYLSVIDIPKLKEIKKITVGFGGRAIVLSKDEKYAFESIENENSVAIIDISISKVVTKVSVGPNPRGLVLDHSTGLLYVTAFTRDTSSGGLAQRNTLSVVDVSNPKRPKFISNIKVGLGPCSVSLLEI